MKKLGKRENSSKQTIEAYRPVCYCYCGCDTSLIRTDDKAMERKDVFTRESGL